MIWEPGYLTEVEKEGAQRPIHSMTAVARVRLPHLLHPLEKQETTQGHKEQTIMIMINTVLCI